VRKETEDRLRQAVLSLFTPVALAVSHDAVQSSDGAPSTAICVQGHELRMCPIPMEFMLTDHLYKFWAPNSHLVAKYNLNLQQRENPVMRIDDYYEYLYTLWTNENMDFASHGAFSPNRQLAQLWLLEHVRAYTGSRIGALVDNAPSLSSEIQPLNPFKVVDVIPSLPSYGDCSLLLIPRPDGSRDALVLGIRFRRTKGGKGRSKP
jgi:hypothetical protein